MNIIFVLFFTVLMWYLIKKMLKEPDYPILNRVGKHVYYHYKSAKGHVTLDSSTDEVDMDEIAKYIMGLVDGTIKTTKLGQYGYDKDGNPILKDDEKDI